LELPLRVLEGRNRLPGSLGLALCLEASLDLGLYLEAFLLEVSDLLNQHGILSIEVHILVGELLEIRPYSFMVILELEQRPLQLVSFEFNSGVALYLRFVAL